MSNPIVAEGSVLRAVGRDMSDIESQLDSSVLLRGATFRDVNLSFNNLRDVAAVGRHFPNVETLTLDNNAITSLAGFASPLSNLHTLWLNNNNITDLEQLLQVLSVQCPKLQYLSLLKNPCCPHLLTGSGELEYGRYRLYVKYRLPTLNILDSDQITEDEAVQAREKGRFLQTKAAETANQSLDPSAAAPQPESDLFSKLTRERPSGAVYSQQRHFYSGKTSEGNRFIGNDAL